MSCVTSEGYVDAAAVLNAKRYEALLISSIVPFIAAVDATNYAKDRASRMDALAQRQISLAEEELAYNQLAWPCEENAIAEAQAPDPYVPIFDVVVGRAQVPIKAQFAKAKLDVKKKYNRYNRGAMSASLAKLCNAQAMAVADAQMLAHRAEQAKVDARDDRDWNRRIEVSALGKNIAQQASGFYKSAGAGLGGMQSAAIGAFNNALGQLGTAFNTYANSSPYVSSQYLYEQQASMKAAETGGIQNRIYDEAISGGNELNSLASSNAAFEAALSGGTTEILDIPMEGAAFGGGVGNIAGTSVQADSTVKSIKVQGRDSRGDRIDITVDTSNITYTNAKDNSAPTTTIDGYE